MFAYLLDLFTAKADPLSTKDKNAMKSEEGQKVEEGKQATLQPACIES